MEQSTVGVVVPTGYSFNLDGTAIYLTMASLFIADALGDPLSVAEQVGPLLFMIVASRRRRWRQRRRLGDARRRTAGPSARTARRVGLIVGIDRFMSEARALTNFSGNAVAHWLSVRGPRPSTTTKVSRVLSGEDPFDEMTMLDEGGEQHEKGRFVRSHLLRTSSAAQSGVLQTKTARSAPVMAASRHANDANVTPSSVEADAGQLRKFSAFDKFSDAELRQLAEAAHHPLTSASWPLVYEDTVGLLLHLAERRGGRVCRRDRVATLGPGEVIGESALLRGQLRSATVTTTGPAEVLRIEQDDLTRLLEEIPALRDTHSLDRRTARTGSARPSAGRGGAPAREVERRGPDATDRPVRGHRPDCRCRHRHRTGGRTDEVVRKPTAAELPLYLAIASRWLYATGRRSRRGRLGLCPAAAQARHSRIRTRCTFGRFCPGDVPL